MKRGRRRFYIVPFNFLDGSAGQLGFSFYAEDDDAIVVELYFEARLSAVIEAAVNGFMDSPQSDG